MKDQIQNTNHYKEQADDTSGTYNYAYVQSTARVALYDDMLSAPQVTEITPAPTADYIGHLASVIYEQAKKSGGSIPYTIIQEVSENFIHAQFTEVIVSILDKGNTIRFADQGPGINNKDKAQLPGFTSAVEPMKNYIRGVGSGLPIVKEYLDFSHGTITIEDNLNAGSVVTISLQSDTKHSALCDNIPNNENPTPFVSAERYPEQYLNPHTPYTETERRDIPYEYACPAQRPPRQSEPALYPYNSYYPQDYPHQIPNTNPQYTQPYNHPIDPIAVPRPHSISPAISPLSLREREFLSIFLSKGALGVTDLVKITDVPQSSTYVILTKLEQAGLIKKTAEQKKRVLTDLGYQVALSL